MCYLINPQVNWKERKNIIVIYLNFNFFFFGKKPKIWIKLIIKNNKIKSEKIFKKIPQEFIKYLIKNHILIHNNKR